MNWTFLFAGLFAWALAGLLPAGAAVAARVAAVIILGVALILTLIGAA